ncbi:MAG: hypothetical protein WDW36_009821 [Sanguina aurantia]
MATSLSSPAPLWILLSLLLLSPPHLPSFPAASAAPLLARLHLTMTPHTRRTISAQACDGDPYREIVLCLYAAWVSPSLGRAFTPPWTSSSTDLEDTQPGATAHLHLAPLLAHISRRGAELDVSTRKASNQAVSVDVLLPWLLRSVHQHAKHLILSCDSNVADLSKISPDFLPYLAEALPLLQMMHRSPAARLLSSSPAEEAALFAAQGSSAVTTACLDPLRHRGRAAYLFLDDSLVVPEPEALRAALQGVQGAVVTAGALLVSASEPSYETWAGPSLACADPSYPVASALAALNACVGATLALLSVPSDLSLLCLSARQALRRPVRYLHFGGSDFALLPGLVRPAWVFQGCDDGLDALDARRLADGGRGPGGAAWDSNVGASSPSSSSSSSSSSSHGGGGSLGEGTWAEGGGSGVEAEVVSEAIRSAVEVGRLVPVCLTSSRRARADATQGPAPPSSWGSFVGGVSGSGSGGGGGGGAFWAPASDDDSLSQTDPSTSSLSSASGRSRQATASGRVGRRLHGGGGGGGSRIRHDSGSGSVTPADPNLLNPALTRLLPPHLSQELRLHYNPCTTDPNSPFSDATSVPGPSPLEDEVPSFDPDADSDPVSDGAGGTFPSSSLPAPGRGCYQALLAELSAIYGPFLLTSPSLIFQNQAHLRELARWDTPVPLAATPAVLTGLATPVFYNPQQRRLHTHLPEVLPTVLRRRASASLSLDVAASAAAAAEAAPALLRPFQAAVSASHVYVPNALLMYFPGGSTPSEVVSFFLTGGCSSLAAPAPSIMEATTEGDYSAGHSRRRLASLDASSHNGTDLTVERSGAGLGARQRTGARGVSLSGVLGGCGTGSRGGGLQTVPEPPSSDGGISEAPDGSGRGAGAGAAVAGSCCRERETPRGVGPAAGAGNSLCYDVLKGSLCQYLQPSGRFDPASSYGRLHMICMSLFSAYSIDTCHSPPAV